MTTQFAFPVRQPSRQVHRQDTNSSTGHSDSQASHQPTVPASLSPPMASISVTAPVQMQGVTSENIRNAKQQLMAQAGPVSRVARLKSWASKSRLGSKIFGKNYKSNYQKILESLDSAAGADSPKARHDALSAADKHRKAWGRRHTMGSRKKHLGRNGQLHRNLELMGRGAGYSRLNSISDEAYIRSNRQRRNPLRLHKHHMESQGIRYRGYHRTMKARNAAKGRDYKPNAYMWAREKGHWSSPDFKAAMSHLESE
jgi:hypothetical protein